MSRPATLLDKAAAVALWTVGLAWLATMMPLLMVAMRLRPSHEIDGLTRLYTRGQVALTLCRWRAEVHPDVDPDGVYLFVQNHVNVLDHVTMYASTPHFKQGIELQSHFDIPIYGAFMRARGTIPVDPDDPRGLLRLRRRMKEELREGRSILAFPEGTRTRTGRVAPFHLGLFHLARALKVPVVPVAVTGMWDVLPTPGWVMRPFQEVTVHVLAPIPTEGLSRDEVPDLAETARARIAEVVDAWQDAREAA